MTWRTPLWRHFEANDGAGAGASAGQTAAAAPVAPPAEPPAPSPSPSSAGPDPQAALAEARFAALAQYPRANVDLLKTAMSPEQAAQIAQATHEQAEALAAAQQQTASAGAPVPSANAVSGAEGEEARRLRELQFKVRQRVRPGARNGRTVLEPWEAEEARELFFGHSWNGHMEHRRAGRGNVSAPPAGAPAAVAQPAALPAPGRAF